LGADGRVGSAIHQACDQLLYTAGLVCALVVLPIKKASSP